MLLSGGHTKTLFISYHSNKQYLLYETCGMHIIPSLKYGSFPVLERAGSRLEIATKLCELRDYKQFSIIRGKTYELNFVLWLKSKHSFWFRSMLNRWLERFQDKSSTIWLRSIWQRDSVNCKFIVGSMKVVHSNWVPQYISKKTLSVSNRR